MRRVLITGAGGFIGRHTLRELYRRGFEVHTVGQRKPTDMDIPVKWHQVNLLDSTATKELVKLVKATHLLHLSWYTKPGVYTNSLENYDWVQASFLLIKYFYEYGGRRVVVGGSCAEYDWNQGLLTETSRLSYANPYAACKNHLRGLVESYSERIDGNFAWGRIFFLYGPHEQQGRLVPSVITSLLKGHEAYCTHGNQIRDFLYVEDVGNALVSLLDSDVKGSVNISSCEPIRLKEIIYEIAEQLGAIDKVKLGAVSAPPSESQIVVGSISRLRSEVGWQPKYDLKQGLQKTINWWKSKIKEEV